MGEWSEWGVETLSALRRCGQGRPPGPSHSGRNLHPVRASWKNSAYQRDSSVAFRLELLDHPPRSLLGQGNEEPSRGLRIEEQRRQVFGHLRVQDHLARQELAVPRRAAREELLPGQLPRPRK